MKKIIIAALVLVSFVSSAFTTGAKEIESRIMNEFKSDYRNASNISLTTLKSDLTRIDFELNGIKLSAFYSSLGEFIGTTQQISLEDLPVNAKRKFAKTYAGYTVKEALKFESHDETAYFISAENENGSRIIKVSTEGFVSVFKKSKM